MSDHSEIQAAGAVVFRGTGRNRRVLIEHRPGYDDWTLPKGKREPGEQLPVTAVREVLEETGVHVRLGLPLPNLSYQVGSGPKRVWWWIGHETQKPLTTHDTETDIVSWPRLGEAYGMLSYPDERELIATAAKLADKGMTGTAILVRHGKARARKAWSAKDWKRPLAARGIHQSEGLIPLLGAYGVTTLHSSTSTRCVQTLTPYAKQRHMDIQTFGLLSEEEALDHDDEVATLMWQLRTQVAHDLENPVAVCGHRPVIPFMQQGLHIPVQHMTTGQCLVAHINNQAETIAVESHLAVL